MDDPSGVRGARRSLAIAFALFTAMVALFWVLPKSEAGGALWLLTLPAALLFPYLSYRVIAPGSVLRTTNVAITMIVALIVLFACGQMIASLALPERLSGTAAVMMTLTGRWRSFALVALLAVGALRLIDRSPSDSSVHGTESVHGSEEPTPTAARPSAVTSGHSPIDTLRPSPLVPTQPVPQPARATMRPPAASRPAAVPAPTPLARPAHERSPQEIPQRSSSEQSSAPAPRPVQKTATVTGASFLELTTLVEVATSLSDPDSPTSLLLTAAPGGLGLTAGGTELGTVMGTWSGTDSLPVRLSAHETAEALASFSPPPETLSILFHVDDSSVVEFRDDHSVQRLALSAVRG